VKRNVAEQVNEENEPTASTWQAHGKQIDTCFIFYCTIEGVVGVCGVFRVGAMAKGTAYHIKQLHGFCVRALLYGDVVLAT